VMNVMVVMNVMSECTAVHDAQYGRNQQTRQEGRSIIPKKKSLQRRCDDVVRAIIC
jgi:hypothetical protein